jgi:guanylate kinase
MSRDKKKIIVFAGPSGVGKSTIVNHLLQTEPERYVQSISCTTRPIRAGEVDGVHYHFLSRKEFEQKILNDEFLEYAIYADHLYGTLFTSVKSAVDKNKTCILILETNGVNAMKKSLLNFNSTTIYIRIIPPSIEELRNRLRARGDTTEESIVTRLTLAKHEMAARFSYKYWDLMIRNDNLTDAIEQVESFLKVK